MEKCIEEIEKQLIERYPLLAAVEVQIKDAYEAMYECFASGHKLLIAGNGGSAADADHIVGELMKGFVKKRPLSDDLKESLCNLDRIQGEKLSKQLQQGLPAIALHNHQALNTAVLNDIDGTVMFAQQVCGYGQQGNARIQRTRRRLARHRQMHHGLCLRADSRVDTLRQPRGRGGGR